MKIKDVVKPKCCGKTMDLIGIDDRRRLKFYCTICFKIILVDK